MHNRVNTNEKGEMLLSQSPYEKQNVTHADDLPSVSGALFQELMQK